MNSCNASIVSNDSVLYELQQTGSTGILIRLTSNEFTENDTLPLDISNITSNNIVLYIEETNLFIPGCELPNLSNLTKLCTIISDKPPIKIAVFPLYNIRKYLITSKLLLVTHTFGLYCISSKM